MTLILAVSRLHPHCHSGSLRGAQKRPGKSIEDSASTWMKEIGQGDTYFWGFRVVELSLCKYRCCKLKRFHLFTAGWLYLPLLCCRLADGVIFTSHDVFIIVPEEILYNNLIIGLVPVAEKKVSLGNDNMKTNNGSTNTKELKSGDSCSTCILFTFYNWLPADTTLFLSNTFCSHSRPLSLLSHSLSHSSPHQHHLFFS